MEHISEREWLVLEELWETDGAELGVLVERLYSNTGWNRNTVLTYLTRMEGKRLEKLYTCLCVSKIVINLFAHFG